jgi:hypothetical protein
MQYFEAESSTHFGYSSIFSGRVMYIEGIFYTKLTTTYCESWSWVFSFEDSELLEVFRLLPQQPLLLGCVDNLLNTQEIILPL